MLDKREFSSLGNADHGWLNARHHFSFGEYHDATRMNWGALRVWNDDQIAPHSGFATHPHRDMEIITFVRQDAITHQDSEGNVGRTEAGDVQVMGAGTGIRHSEYNRESVETQLFQIWITPRQAGGTPRWDAKSFPKGERRNTLETLASGYSDDLANGALEIRADACILGATLETGHDLQNATPRGYKAYLVASRGKLIINGIKINERDGIAISEEDRITITADQNAKLIIAETFSSAAEN